MSTREYNYSGFTRINVRFAMEVEVVRGDSYSISVSGADTLVNNIEVSQEGDRLVLGYKLNFVSFFTAPFTRAHARITMPELHELHVTGAVQGVVQGLKQVTDFSLYVSGASHINIDNIDVGGMRWDLSGASHIKGQANVTGAADFRVNGASHIQLKGRAQDVNIDASGASNLELRDFTATNMRIRLTGASRSLVNISGKLDVDLNGASVLEYGGQPVMGEVRVAGASNLKKH